MPALRRIVLDVLKPHQPNALEFARAIADREAGCRVTVRVAEMDEKTESVIVLIEGQGIDFNAVETAISGMGASIHSIDEVEVDGDALVEDVVPLDVH